MRSFSHLAQKKPAAAEPEDQGLKRFLTGTPAHLHDAQAGADAIIAAGKKRRGES